MSAGDGPVPAALAALRAHNPAEAVRLLTPVVHAPELDDPELLDVRARLCSLYAQALLESGETADAGLWVRKALRATSTLKDSAGLAEVRALQGRIVGATADAEAARQRQVEREHIAATPLDTLLQTASTPAARAGILTKKAAAHASADEVETAVRLYHRAIAAADAAAVVREQVLARLGIAAIDPQRATAWIRAAQALAERAEEYTLLGTIAREATRLRVPLPTIHGPKGLRELP